MKKTIITKDKFKIMPWKNGAGMTAEIDIQPPTANFQDSSFEWRLSSARIEDENQFSQFPGYNRILTVLSGEGLILNSQELGPFEVFEFEGEDRIECSLIDHPVEDLGVIFKRDRYEASMQILDVTAPMYLKLQPGTHFFFALSNPAKIDGAEFQAPEILKIEDASSVEITGETFPIHILKIDILDK